MGVGRSPNAHRKQPAPPPPQEPEQAGHRVSGPSHTSFLSGASYGRHTTRVTVTVLATLSPQHHHVLATQPKAWVPEITAHSLKVLLRGWSWWNRPQERVSAPGDPAQGSRHPQIRPHCSPFLAEGSAEAVRVWEVGCSERRRSRVLQPRRRQYCSPVAGLGVTEPPTVEAKPVCHTPARRAAPTALCIAHENQATRWELAEGLGGPWAVCREARE